MKLFKIQKDIIVFGAKENNINNYIMSKCNNVLFFLDNKNYDSDLYGCQVKRPDSWLLNYKEDAVIVIATYSHWDEIISQLTSLGWKREGIVIALKQNEFKSFGFLAFCNNVDLENPVPQILNLELSGYCNLKCIYCPFHGELNLKDGHKGLMTWEILEEIVNQIKNIDTIKTLDCTGPGEIFINKNWFEMIQYICDNTSISDVIIYTNGMLLNEENVDKITNINAENVTVEVSIDGENEEENNKYRVGADYKLIRSNVIHAEEKFKNADSNINVVITNCYPMTRQYIRNHNGKVDSKLNVVPDFLKRDFKNVEIASQSTFFYGKYDKELSCFEKVKVSWPEDKIQCLNLFNRMAINYRGELLRCSCGNAGIEGIADCRTENLLDIWHNDKEINSAREAFLHHINKSNFCDWCPGKGIGEYFVLVKKDK